MSDDLPETIDSEEELDELLSRPTSEVVELFSRLNGRIVIAGAGGKIGPSLTRLACRARDAAESDVEIVAVSRFTRPELRDRLTDAGVVCVACDLLDGDAVAGLPSAAHVIYLAGMKFGTSDDPPLTWVSNALIPAHVARRYADARIVAFSTGCVYPMVDVRSGGSREEDDLTPPGEYANSCVARERIFQYFSERNDTPMVLLRLNYAAETRYGVPHDIACRVRDSKPVDVTMGWFNVIWQGDVNAFAFRLLDHCEAPARPLNLTGRETLSVRRVAERIARRMGREAQFAGTEADTALLSDASRAMDLLGPPHIDADRLIDWTTDWVAAGGAELGKPTHFQTRDGRF